MKSYKIIEFYINNQDDKTGIIIFKKEEGYYRFHDIQFSSPLKKCLYSVLVTMMLII